MKNPLKRCPWGDSEALYVTYHDEEWGRPVVNDIQLFEKVCLEGFQSGLSWITILRKRDHFRQVFAGFDFEKVALFDEADVERLVQDTGIIRHRGKINATINNAQRALELRDEFDSLAKYFWSFEPKPETRPTDMSWENLKTVAITKESMALSKDLKKRGWKFVGPTTCYAFMQAMGMVNDHIEGCYCRAGVEKARAELVRP